MKTNEIVMLIDHLDKSSLVELELKTGDFEIALRKKEAFATDLVSDTISTAAPVSLGEGKINQSSPDGASPVSGGAEELQSQECIGTTQSGEVIESPIVGTFYRTPSPDSPAYVEEGSQVKEGETLCILEAMKVMNELEADFDCTVMDILVENGQMVEYGTPLFRVERT